MQEWRHQTLLFIQDEHVLSGKEQTLHKERENFINIQSKQLKTQKERKSSENKKAQRAEASREHSSKLRNYGEPEGHKTMDTEVSVGDLAGSVVVSTETVFEKLIY